MGTDKPRVLHIMHGLTIGKRIVIGFAAVLAITLLLGSLAIERLFSIESIAKVIVGDCLPGAYLSGRIETEITAAEMHVRKHILSEDAAAMAEVEKEVTEAREQVGRLYDEYARTITQAEDRQLYEKAVSFRAGYLSRRDAVLALSHNGKKREAATLASADLEPYFDLYMAAVRDVVAFNRRSAEDNSKRISAAIAMTRWALGIGMIAALALGGAAATLIVRGATSTLRRVANAMEESSAQVAAAANQVSASSQTLAEGSSEQAASLEETSASLEEVSGMTRRNVDGAQQAKELAGQARAAADTGAGNMQAMKVAMDEIKTSSGDIAQIIKTIDEIAFQTNILALNAAVEAARAGEAGMGFAVVADEVRNLAQRAAQSARETSGKIEVAIAKSDHGARLSGKVSESLDEIVDKSRKVDALVAEIATASLEQNQGITQVNTAIVQMDKVTQSNASGAEETASAAEELNAQAAAMRENVAELLQLVGRARGTDTARTAKAAVDLPSDSAAPGRFDAPQPLKRPTLQRPSAHRAPTGRSAVSRNGHSHPDA